MIISKESLNVKSLNEILREHMERSPGISELKLEYMNISNLLPVLHLLAEFKELKRLSLHGNMLKQLPVDLSVLESLEELDLSQNPFDEKRLDIMLKSLKSLPKLRLLHCQVPKFMEQNIAENISTLQFLNNTKIIREPAKVPYAFKQVNEKSLKNFEENMVGHLRDLLQFEVRYLGQKKDPQAEGRFRLELQAISATCINKLTKEEIRATESLERIMLYTTKFEMYEVLKLRAINLCMDIYGDVGKFMRTVFDEEDKIFKTLAELALTLSSVELDLKEKEEEENMQSKPSIIMKSSLMQKEIKRMRRQQEEYRAQITQLDTHCRKLNQALFRYAKGDTSAILKANPIATFHSKDNSNQGNSLVVSNNLAASYQGKTAFPFKQRPSQLKSRQVVTQGQSHPANNRTLTLKQMKQIIEEIYEAKLHFDEKNYRGKIARETMNQYIFTHLNQKYGLKTLTIQAANSIVSGIQAYSSEDNDVAVFGKILRNEIDEEFRLAQAQLKSSVHDYMRLTLKEKMPYKSAIEINEALTEKVNNEVSFEECKYIINYMFHKSFTSQILRKVENAMRMYRPKQIEPQSRRKTRDQNYQGKDREKAKVKFSVFLHQVLDFQLKMQEKKLKPLVNAFRMKDTDADGVVNEEQFIQVIQTLSENSSSMIPTFLNIVDPYETKTITFSQMARLVTNYPEKDPIINHVANLEDDQDVNQD